MSEEKSTYSLTPDKNGESTNPVVDIYKIIDDAMEKKNREVTIFIRNRTTSVHVKPIDNDPRWIEHIHINNDDPTFFVPPTFECSECSCEVSHPTSYCPYCGEKLKQPKSMKEGD